jgi:hypothetical protein
VRAGSGVTISGSGSPGDPWTINAIPLSTGTIKVEDTFTIDLVLSGAGTLSDPYVLRANASQIPGGLSTGHGITGLGNGPSPLRLDVCTYDDLAAVTACAP